MKFRRCRSIDTLETVYEHLKYEGDAKEEYAMTSAYDHRKAELTVDKSFDRVPASCLEISKLNEFKYSERFYR
nr:Hha/YmoA family nucleoid-associated regulatory protein [Pantoea ananatis]